MIEQVIRSAIKTGIDDFYVVTGYNGEIVHRYLDELASNCNISISHVINEEREKDNGLSVLRTGDGIKESLSC